MTNLRKAAKDGDWSSMLVEYAANKAGLGALIPPQSQNTGGNEPNINSKPPIPSNMNNKL
jgi:hypothetical protein